MWRASAAFGGVLFVIAFIFAVGTGGPPASVDPTATSETIAQALVDNRTNLVTGNYILLLSAFLLITFAGYLRHIAVPEEDDEWPLTVALGGGVVTASVLVVVALIGISQGQLESYGVDTGVARTLLTLGWNSMWMVVPGLAALIGATTLMAFNYETLPRTVGALGTIVTIVLVTPWWGLGIIGALLWIAATSITLGIRELRSKDD
jgi:hypothetical protein